MNTTATPQLTQRQADIIAACAMREMANVYPEGSIPSLAYAAAGVAATNKLDDWTDAEHDEAFAIAAKMPQPVYENQ